MGGTNPKLTTAVETYLDDLRRIRASGGATGERSSYGPLATLLNAVGATLKPKVFCVGEFADQGAGHPDFGLYTAKQVQRGRPRVLARNGDTLSQSPARVDRTSGSLDRTATEKPHARGHRSTSGVRRARAEEMRIPPEISGTTIVLVGSFNPAIFTPAWFELHGLLPKGTAETAALDVAHPQATAFNAEWLNLNVGLERFVAETAQAPDVRIRDLVVRTFREHLNHTPLNALGINRNVHFDVETLADRDRIGRILAPIEPWGAWGDAMGVDGIHGGLTSITMSQNDPEGRPKGGRINVRVEPSTRIGNGRTGVFVNVNDHYECDANQQDSAEAMIQLLEENFDASIERSNGLIDQIMSLK